MEQVDTRAAAAVEPLIVTLADLTRLTGLGLSSARCLVSSGEITSFKVGRRVCIPLDSVREWIARRASAVA
jgi:excisionase family DNA binding protein